MTPPRIAGFDHVRLLGSGGYSDVFLYEQQMPKRQVAIKVLLSEALDEQGRRQFSDEANAMASVSAHPFIVTILHADVALGAHPFLVMEFYPRENFSVRARTEQLSVAEVLRTGVQVASAVETAHRAGILHRDIKPANILTSDYGRPGLTDFGIASSVAADDPQSDTIGMSIPWAPPEVVNGTALGDASADVYSLGATLYTLLAGRSPYEVPGGSNRSLDLVDRLERADLGPTGRGDVPESLERLLRQAMAKSPAARPQSAAALARALQQIEAEQQLAVTTFEVREDPGGVRSRTVDPDEDGTRLKNPVVIRSQTASVPVAPTSRTGAGDPAAAAGEHTVQRAAAAAGLIDGIAPPASGSRAPDTAASRSPAGADDPAGPSTSGAPDLPPVAPMPRRPANGTGDRHRDADLVDVPRSRWPAVASVVLVVVFLLIGARVLVGGGDGADERDPTDTIAPAAPIVPAEAPPTPTDVNHSPAADGSVTISWTPIELAEGDMFELRDEGEKVAGPTTETSVVLQPGQIPPCVRVVLVRNGAVSEPSERKCL